MLVCSSCSTQFPTTTPRWRCDCGAYVMLADAGLFAPDSLRERPPSLWRYREALGILDESNIVSLGEGSTPLIETRLAGAPVSLKLDYLCPTGSYKDRGSTVMVSKL